jgi:sulfatase modifying factor 1
VLREYANYSWLGTEGYPAAVSSGKPGAYGLYNMAGNVAEWTRTLWQPNYTFQQDDNGRAQVEVDNDSGNLIKDVVIRGGSVASISLDIRCTSRSPYVPTGDNAHVGGIGFRVVLHHKP